MQRNKAQGSSPFIRTENARIARVSIKEGLAHLAHLGSDDTPGGDNLNQKMKAMNITLHTAGKRWYVSYYTANIEGKRERKREYGYVNKEKDANLKMQKLIELQQRIFYSLTSPEAVQNTPINQSCGIYKATNEAVAQKQFYLKPNAYLAILKNIKPWLKFLLQHNLETRQIHEITTTDIFNYRNWRMQHVIKKKNGDRKKISNRTVNNNIDELRTLFNVLIKQPGVLARENPCNAIVNIPSRSEAHVAYTDDEAKLISDRLKEKDPFLLFYIKFIAYVFLRCDEARLLQVKHFDIARKKIILTADNNKTNYRTQKLIPDIFIADIIKFEIDKYPKDHYIFSVKKTPGLAPVNRDYFSKKFRRHKKHFGLTPLHTIYGFRHTFVCQLIESGMPWHKIMALTGHKTMSSFEKYARSIMQRPAEDLSSGFTVKM